MDRDGAKSITFEKPKIAERGLTDSGCICQHRIEDRLQLTGRTGDDLQYFRCSGLLLQRLGQIVGALAQFIEQPCVFNRYDGLCSEVLDQFDLLVGEAAYLLPIYANSTNELIILQHRDPDQRPRASQFDKGLAHLVLAL